MTRVLVLGCGANGLRCHRHGEVLLSCVCRALPYGRLALNDTGQLVGGPRRLAGVLREVARRQSLRGVEAIVAGVAALDVTGGVASGLPLVLLVQEANPLVLVLIKKFLDVTLRNQLTALRQG